MGNSGKGAAFECISSCWQDERVSICSVCVIVIVQNQLTVHSLSSVSYIGAASLREDGTEVGLWPWWTLLLSISSLFSLLPFCSLLLSSCQFTCSCPSMLLYFLSLCVFIGSYDRVPSCQKWPSDWTNSALSTFWWCDWLCCPRTTIK